MALKKSDLLIEIQTEEMPPKSLKQLGEKFLTEIETRLGKAHFPFKKITYYATPRRLAVKVDGLTSQQPEIEIERRGPLLSAAFENGQATKACIGFARSCGVEPEALTTIKNAQGEWVGFRQLTPGKTIQEMLPPLITEALQALPVAKRMRWGSSSVEFVRPVHHVTVLFGKDIVNGKILDITIGKTTVGHRFLSKKPITLSSATTYEKQLEKNYVIADFNKRRERITQQAKQLAKDSTVVMDDALLDEVTGLVEWPTALLGQFDPAFLQVPQEALISAMQDHQRYFPIVDQAGKLLPNFIAVSNLVSNDDNTIIKGNERVLRARLSDADFFFKTDKKRTLEERLSNLKEIVFQDKLGTIYDKAERIAKLAAKIAKQCQQDEKLAARAALLSKTDLTTDMVGEFPELQGVAGYYYALHDGEDPLVAQAIKEHYLPRFAGDELPSHAIGSIVALADKLDTLVGIFGVNQIPTGDKDPFGLRRCALGILRILIQQSLDLDLLALLEFAKSNYTQSLPNTNLVSDALKFILERLKPWYQDHQINPDVYASVAALNITRPFDFHRRIEAVQRFKQMPDAESLSIANKRVSNILAKYETTIDAKDVNPSLFELEAERVLALQLNNLDHAVMALSEKARYMDVLTQLADLRKPVDDFFDQVMVMSEHKAQRENRLLLLTKLRTLFLQVADVALLQTR